jgi:hypothetical protein
MTKQEIAVLVEQIPQGLDADDFLCELVNRAIKANATEGNRLVKTYCGGKPNYCTPEEKNT